MDIPAFHPEWLVTFWLTTPGINKLDPHLTSLFLVGILIVIIVVKMKKRKAALVPLDSDEEHFQRLVKEKGIIEGKLTELEQDRGGLSDEQYAKKRIELEEHLNKTTEALKYFI